MQDYFDPNTGELIGGDIGGTGNMGNAGSTGGTDSMPYASSPAANINMTVQPPKKKGLGLWIGVGCGVVVIAAAAAVIATKLFSNPAVKIGTAMANTFKETSQIQKDLDIMDMLSDGNAGVQMDMEYDHQTLSVSGAYDFSSKRKAVNVKFNGDFDDIGDFEVDFTAQLDKDKVAMSLKPASDEILTYYYTKDNKGDFMDALEDEDIDIDELNASLEKLYELDLSGASTYKDMWDAAADEVLEEVKKIEIEKIDKKEEFKIDGKKRSCGGYQMEITEDNMEAIIDAARKAFEKELDDISADGEIRDALDDAVDEVFDELEDSISGMKDIDLSLYMYNKQIACIRIEAARSTVDIIFHGGDYPAQNVEIVLDGNGFDDETALELTGETKDDTETMELSVFGESFFELEYDTKSGELSVTSDEADLEFEAVVKRTKESLTVEIDDIDDASLTLEITDDGEIKTLKGDEINLGEADEDELQDYAEDILKEYDDIFYYLMY